MNTNVAVYTKNKNIFDQLAQSFSGSVFTLQDSPDLKELKDKNFVICDRETFSKRTKDFNHIKKDFLYIISELDDEENMKLIEKYELHHLVGLNETVYAQEILTCLHKSYKNKIWGLEPYLDQDSADMRIISLSDSKNTNEIIQDALNNFDFSEYFSSPNEYIQVMANELISNSLYKGPNAKRMEKGLDSVDRRNTVFLKGSELVQVSIGMDSKGVALSVQDSFGGLNYKLLIASLKRSFEEKTVMDKKDGAGLGLYLTYLHSNQFIINFKEKFRTEVICIIDKNKRYKNYKQRIRSFHFFQEVAGEKIND